MSTEPCNCDQAAKAEKFVNVMGKTLETIGKVLESPEVGPELRLQWIATLVKLCGSNVARITAE